MTDFQTQDSTLQDVTKAEGRSALAVGKIHLSEESYPLVKENKIPKGDVLSVAQITGIFGAKKTSELFPFCKPNTISEISIEFGFDDDERVLLVQAFTKTNSCVSVEMEALTAVSITCLAVYDMCKSTDQTIWIGEVKLLSKTGGQKGGFRSN